MAMKTGTTQYQPWSIRRGVVSKIKSLEEQLDPALNPLAKSQAVGPGGWDTQMKQLEGLKAKLEAMTPPAVKDSGERNILEKRARLLESSMKMGSSVYRIPDMPSKMEMKNNPDDSTRRHMTWNKRWMKSTVDDEGNLVEPTTKGYGAQLEWKDLMYRLFKQEDESGDAPGIGSIERFRPDFKGVPLAKDHTGRTFAQTGNLSQSQYDQTFPEHEPLPNEIQAGKYFENCLGNTPDNSVCGAPVLDKTVPYCHEHVEQFAS